MGASSWEYRTAFSGDVAVALEALQRRVFDEGDYLWPHGGHEPGLPARPMPKSVDELWKDEDIQYSGTHSVLDIGTVIASSDPDEVGTLRPLTTDEIRSYFDTSTPTLEDFDRTVGENALPYGMVRWSGWCMPLFADGLPVELAIWGYSGD